MREGNPTRRSDDTRVREALDLLDNVARGVARQLGSRFDLDDLKGYAHEAISDVVAKYDDSRGVSFRAFARLRLRGAIIDGLRKESGLPRGVAARLRAMEAADLYVDEKAEEHATQKPTTAAEADARVQSFLKGLATAYATGLVAREGGEAAPDEADPELATSRKEMRVLLDRALTDIGDPEGTILRRHYFLDEDLQDAAAHVGLSKSWGSRLHARGIEKLSKRLAELRGTL
ncbi:MAG: sigma-70 family RNA polymerase sigma factor [Deltaproteobacteria bacterium]|nr:sigma-70 family RNA polymerase sigma factor [Deltaproteobacteria bacterium]